MSVRTMYRLSAKQRKHLKALFEECDKDKDGGLTPNECIHLIITLPSLHRQPTKSMQNFINTQTTINFDRLVHMIEFSRSFDINTHFNGFDEDGDGKISIPEVQAFMEKLKVPVSEDEAKEMIAAGDKDGDGQLSKDEFATMIFEKYNLYLL